MGPDQFNYPTANPNGLYGQDHTPRVSLFNMGDQGGMLGALLPLLAQQLMGHAGAMPMQFRPQAGSYTQMQSMQFENARQIAIAQSAPPDQQNIELLIEKVATKFFGEDPAKAKQRAGVIGSDLQPLLPFIAQLFPQLMSAAGGQQGSSMVAAQQFQLAGRHMVDPSTGSLGMSGQHAADFSVDVTKMLYGNSNDEVAMKGIPVDRAAEFLAAATRRGMGPRGLHAQLGAEGMSAVKDMFETGKMSEAGIEAGQKLSEDEIEQLDATGTNIERTLRKFDAHRTAKWMKDMAGVMRALEDIFGPGMSGDQMLTAMNQLTQHDAISMSPEQLEMSLRTTQVLAESSDLGMEHMTQMMAQGGQTADQLGLSRHAAIPTAHAAAAFGKAFDQQNLGGYGFDKERFTINDQQLRLQAMASPVAEQLAATMRLGEMSPFETDTEAEALFQALQEGRTTYKDPNTGQNKSVYLDEQEWREVMKTGGVSHQTAIQARGQQAMNRERAEDAGLQDTVRAMQFDIDVAPELAAAADNSLFIQLKGTGQELDHEATQRTGMALSKKLRDMSMETLTDDTKRREALQEELQTALTAEGVDTDKLEPGQLARITAIIDAEMDTSARDMNFKDLEELIAMSSPELLRQGRVQHMRAKQEGRLASEMAGLGREEPLRRIFQMIREAGDDETVEGLIAKAFGGVPQEQVAEELRPLLDELTKEQDAYAAILARPGSIDEETGQMAADAKQETDQALARIHDIIGNIKKQMPEPPAPPPAAAPGAPAAPGTPEQAEFQRLMALSPQDRIEEIVPGGQPSMKAANNINRLSKDYSDEELAQLLKGVPDEQVEALLKGVQGNKLFFNEETRNEIERAGQLYRDDTASADEQAAARPISRQQHEYAAVAASKQEAADASDEKTKDEDLSGQNRTLRIAGTMTIPGLGTGEVEGRATSGQFGLNPMT